eukprot:TRINITY_DN45590_c0_g1_i1.p1 TRINITY_DN45590_c0_g1~~TRINITY_DN45590_c0_g1_i1.p1  ORF type:complete len:238 (-),score=21.42 TRINITY_DN45590_c0_g1_i1:136-849(-)
MTRFRKIAIGVVSLYAFAVVLSSPYVATPTFYASPKKMVNAMMDVPGAVVMTRKYLPDRGDDEAIRRIWSDGLHQTVENSPWYLRPIFACIMSGLKWHATKSGGDLADIAHHWIGEDRQMFVAELVDPVNAGSGGGAVVGCCAVRTGNSENAAAAPPHVDCCSVWRVSVDEDVRRRGVGIELMRAAEDWARQKGKTRMCLVTGNPVAANFYTKKCCYRKITWTSYEKDLAKSLVGNG